MRSRSQSEAVNAIQKHALGHWLSRITQVSDSLPGSDERKRFLTEIKRTLQLVAPEYIASGCDVGRTGLIMDTRFQALIESFSDVEGTEDVCKENC